MIRFVGTLLGLLLLVASTQAQNATAVGPNFQNLYPAGCSESSIRSAGAAANAATGGTVLIPLCTVAMAQPLPAYAGVIYQGTGWGPDNRIPSGAQNGTILQATTTAITSGTYNSGTGAVVLTMTSPVAFATGTGIALFSLTGTGGFATLNSATCAALNGPTATSCNYIATISNGGSTVSFTGPTGLGASTITGGTLTFDGFDYNNSDLGSPPANNTVFINGMLVGAGFRNLSFTGYASALKIGGLYNPGAQSFLLDRVFSTASINWDMWLENVWSSTLKHIVINSGGVGAFAFVGSGTSAVFNNGNSRVADLYVGVQALTTRGAVVWARNTSSVNEVSFPNLESEHLLTSTVSQAATMANASANITVTDGTKFPVGMPVTFSASVNGLTGAASPVASGQTYFVLTNNGSNVITVGSTPYGSTFTSTGNSPVNIRTRGFALSEVAAQDAGSTMSAINISAPDWEATSTIGVLLVNSNGARITGGFVNSGSFYSTFTLRGSTNNYINTTSSNFTVDADSASTTNSLVGRGGAQFPVVYFNSVGASGLVSSTADTKWTSPAEGQLQAVANGVNHLDFNRTNVGDMTLGTTLPTSSGPAFWMGGAGNNASLLITPNLGNDKFATGFFFNNSGPTYLPVFGVGHTAGTNSFLTIGRAATMGGAVTNQFWFTAETGFLGFGGNTVSFPCIGNTGAAIKFRLCDNSGAASIVGTATNDNASAGSIGEVLSSNCPGAATTATVTITIASPAVITWTSHGFTTACPVVFTTTGALPTGLTAGTTVYIDPASVTANTFQVATSLANALAGTDINTSGTQSGTQTSTAGASASTTVAIGVTGLALTAGDWDCNARLARGLAASTSVTLLKTSINTSIADGSLTTGTMDQASLAANVMAADHSEGVGPVRESLASTTNVFLVQDDTFTVSTNKGYGSLRCRRMR